MRLSTFDFNYMIWGQFGDNPATIRGPIGRGGPINTSGSRRNDFVQYCKVGRQTEQFWIKMYPRPLLIFTVVRIDQIYNIIYCFKRNIFQNCYFGMLTSFNLTFIPSEFRLGKFRDKDHQEDAPHFKLKSLMKPH